MTFAASLIDAAPTAVRAMFAAALPGALLDVWWSRGEYERVYAVSRWHDSPYTRASSLAWYAAIDPDPASARAVAAAREALTVKAMRTGVLALVPLVEPAITSRVRALAEDSARAIPELRIDLTIPAAFETMLTRAQSHERSYLLACAAICAASTGDLDRANALHTRAWESVDEVVTSLTPLVLATRALGAWAALPERASSLGAHVASLAGDVEGALTCARDHADAIGTSALFLDPLPAQWRNVLEPLVPAEIELQYTEGLITCDERWAKRLGHAACAGAPAVDAVVKEMLDEAHTQVLAVSDGLKRAAEGRVDEALPARLEKRVAPLVEQIERERKLDGRVGYRLERVFRTARAGARDLARQVVERIEAAVGPIAEADPFIARRLLVAAAGRSQVALALALDAFEEDLTPWITALALDGHVEEARQRFEQHLTTMPTLEQLTVLAPAIPRLDPASVAAFGRAIDDAVLAVEREHQLR